MSDYKKRFNDLNRLIPEVYKNPVLTGLVDNLFNRFLTKQETIPRYGIIGNLDASTQVTVTRLDENTELDIYVEVIDPSKIVDGEEITLTLYDALGQVLDISSSAEISAAQTIIGRKIKFKDKLIIQARLVSSKLQRLLSNGRKYKVRLNVTRASARVPFIAEPNLDRELNQIIPFSVVKVGDGDTRIFSFNDVLNRLKALGIDTGAYLDWGRQRAHNLNLPIDYDKFVNFSQYYWFGHLDLCVDYLQVDSMTPGQVYEFTGSRLGIAANLVKRRIAVKRVAEIKAVRTDSSLASVNSINFSGVTIDATFNQAPALINETLTFSVIADSAGNNLLRLIYDGHAYDFTPSDPTHAIATAPGSLTITVSFNPTRVIVGEVFKLSFIPTLVEVNETSYSVTPAGIRFTDSRLDGATLIVQFFGKAHERCASYNPSFAPQYYCIARAEGELNDWQLENFWIHVDDIELFNQNNLRFYPNFFNSISVSQLKQATRPIIEFSATARLNSVIDGHGGYLDDDADYFSLLNVVGIEVQQRKTVFNQAPLFDIYYHTGIHARRAAPIIEYRAGEILDPELGIYVSRTESGELEFNCNLFTDDGKILCYKDDGILKTAWDHASTSYPVYVYRDAEKKLITLSFKNLENRDWDFASVTYVSPLVAAMLAENGSWPINSDITEILGDPSNGWLPGNITRISFEIDERLNGAWLQPENAYQNLLNENKRVIAFNELFSHFRSIIIENQKQNGGVFFNPYRFIEHKNLGLGGTIKSYDKTFQLFCALHWLDRISIPAIIDFAKYQYKLLLSEVETFVKNNIIEFLARGTVTLSNERSRYAANYALNPAFAEDDPRLAGLARALDDYLSTRGLNVFSDTTSGVKNWIQTLPYLGIVKNVQPAIVTESVIGFPPDDSTPVLRHHDSHVSLLTAFTSDDVASMVRSEVSFYDEYGVLIKINSALQPGDDPAKTRLFNHHVGPTRPETPFNNQLWFNPETNALHLFNGGQLSSAPPRQPSLDDLWFSFDQGVMLRWNGSIWVPVDVDPSSLWIPVDLSYFVNKAKLDIERRLYEGCHYDQSRLKNLITADEKALNAALEGEFLTYARREGLETYEPTFFNPQNAFTWNYSRVKFPYVNAGVGCWVEIYTQHCGTPRPDLEPWRLMDHPEKPADWDATYKDPTGNRRWKPEMWNDIRAYIATSVQPLRKICVDPVTERLLPPYVSPADAASVYALTSEIPAGISNRFKFADKYVPEMIWRRSIDFQYDLLKAAYKLDPLGFVTEMWGLNETDQVGTYAFHRRYLKRATGADLLLHSEAKPSALDNLQVRVSGGVLPELWIEVLHWNRDRVKLRLTTPASTTDVFFDTRDRFTTITVDGCTVTLFELYPTEYNLGDKVRITNNVTRENYPYPVYRQEGIGQWFVNYCRFNNISLVNSTCQKIVKNNDVRLGYRVGGFLADGTVSVITSAPINESDYTIAIKRSGETKTARFDALRVSVVKIGQKAVQDSQNPNLFYPTEDAGDWEFMIEKLAADDASFTYFAPSNDAVETFQALGGQTCGWFWKKQYSRSEIRTTTLPMTVVGLQGLIDVLFGYANYLDEVGWRFSSANDTATDPDTGRPLTWQYLIERFIDRLYRGNLVPSSAIPGIPTLTAPLNIGSIFNPAPVKIWFKTSVGTVSPFERVVDQVMGQRVTGVLGNVIDPNELLIVRAGDLTEIKSNAIIGSVKLFIEEYEHVILFNDRLITTGEIFFNKFAGVHRESFTLSCEKTDTYTGRLSTGGFYLRGQRLLRNLESSVDNLARYYDSSQFIVKSRESTEAKKLLGYNDPQFFDRNISEKTKFEFWKGLLFNKGTNHSINAFFNSPRFKSMSTDEYWAFKIAEYGEQKQTSYPELKVFLDDVRTSATKLDFTGTLPGWIQVLPTDARRWLSNLEFEAGISFESERLQRQFVTPGIVTPGGDQAQKLLESRLIHLPEGTDMVVVNRLIDPDNPGQYIVNQARQLSINPALADDYVREPAAFIQINSSLIEIPEDSVDFLNNHTLEIIAIGLPSRYFDPIKLIDYKNNVVAADIQIWDPARKLHNTATLDDVDVQWSADPARYNQTSHPSTNPAYDPHRAWGKEQVGKIWWNTENLGYKRYYDPTLIKNLDERLSIWGDLADYASVDIYQWIESDVSPAEYALDPSRPGEPALQKTLFKVREFYSRPIAWATTTTTALPAFNESLTSDRSLFIGINQLVLSHGSWNEYNLTPATRVSGALFSFVNNNLDKSLASDIIKPFGEAQVAGAPLYVIGSTFDPTSIYLEPNQIIQAATATPGADAKDEHLGQHVLSFERSGTSLILTATNVRTGARNQARVTLPESFDESIEQELNLTAEFAPFTLSCSVIYRPPLIEGALWFDPGNPSATPSITDVVVDGVPVTTSTDLDNHQRGMAFTLSNGVLYVRSNGTFTYRYTGTLASVNSGTTLDSITYSLTKDGVNTGSQTYDFKPTIDLTPTDLILASMPDDSYYATGAATLLDKVGTALASANDQIYLRSALPVQVTIPFKFYDKLNNLVDVMARDVPVIDAKTIGAVNAQHEEGGETPNIADWFEGWIIYDEPTPGDVELDRPFPNNQFYPVPGDFIPVSDAYYHLGGQQVQRVSREALDFIKASQPFTLPDKTTLSKVKTAWSDWTRLTDKTFRFTIVKPETFNFASELLFTNNIRVFVNGFETNDYSLADGVLTITPRNPSARASITNICLGDEVVVKYLTYRPTKDELDRGDNVAIDVQLAYRADIDYTRVDTRDPETGEIASTRYYFWIKNSGMPLYDRHSLLSIKNSILNVDGTYACFPIIAPDGSYRQLVFHNLKRFIGASDQYKLQFVKDFSLRDTSTDHDQKNIHEEWILQQPSQLIKVAGVLWNKLVDSACGMTARGTPLPAARYLAFDAAHGTATRYGLEPDQILLDPAEIRETILDVLNQRRAAGNFEDFKFTRDAQTSYGYDVVETYLANPASIRMTLERIYEEAAPALINEIFFAVLERALSVNRQMRGVFKTSYIAIITKKKLIS